MDKERKATSSSGGISGVDAVTAPATSSRHQQQQQQQQPKKLPLKPLTSSGMQDEAHSPATDPQPANNSAGAGTGSLSQPVVQQLTVAEVAELHDVFYNEGLIPIFVSTNAVASEKFQHSPPPLPSIPGLPQPHISSSKQAIPPTVCLPLGRFEDVLVDILLRRITGGSGGAQGAVLAKHVNGDGVGSPISSKGTGPLVPNARLEAVKNDVHLWAAQLATPVEGLRSRYRSSSPVQGGLWGSGGDVSNGDNASSPFPKPVNATATKLPLVIQWSNITSSLIRDAESKDAASEAHQGLTRLTRGVVPCPAYAFHASSPNRVALVGAGRGSESKILTGGHDGLVKIWSAQTGAFEETLSNTGSSWIIGMAALSSPPNAVLVASSNAQVTIYELPGGSVIQKYIGCLRADSAISEVTELSVIHTQRFGMTPGSSGARQVKFNNSVDHSQQSFTERRRLARGGPVTRSVPVKPIVGLVSPSVLEYLSDRGLCFFGTITGTIGCFDVSEDLRQATLITGSSVKSIKLLFSAAAHLDTVTSIRYSPKNMVVITAGLDGCIYRISLEGGKNWATHAAPQRHNTTDAQCKPILGLEWQETAQMLVSYTSDRVVKFWSLMRSEPLHTMQALPHDICSAAFIGTEQLAVLTSDKSISIFDLKSFRLMQVITQSVTGEKSGGALDALSATVIKSAADAGGCLVFDAIRQMLVCCLRAPVQYAQKSALMAPPTVNDHSANDKKVVAAATSIGDSVNSSVMESRPISHQLPVLDMAIQRHTRTLYSIDEQTVCTWDIATGTRSSFAAVEKQASKVAATSLLDKSFMQTRCGWAGSESLRLITGTQSGIMMTWSPSATNVLSVESLLSITPDGSNGNSSSSNSNSINRENTSSRRHVSPSALACTDVSCMACSGPHTVVCVASTAYLFTYDTSVVLVDGNRRRTSVKVMELPAARGSIASVRFLRDTFVAFGTIDATVYLVNFEATAVSAAAAGAAPAGSSLVAGAAHGSGALRQARSPPLQQSRLVATEPPAVSPRRVAPSSGVHAGSPSQQPNPMAAHNHNQHLYHHHPHPHPQQHAVGGGATAANGNGGVIADTIYVKDRCGNDEVASVDDILLLNRRKQNVALFLLDHGGLILYHIGQRVTVYHTRLFQKHEARFQCATLSHHEDLMFVGDSLGRILCFDVSGITSVTTDWKGMVRLVHRFQASSAAISSVAAIDSHHWTDGKHSDKGTSGSGSGGIGSSKAATPSSVTPTAQGLHAGSGTVPSPFEVPSPADQAHRSRSPTATSFARSVTSPAIGTQRQPASLHATKSAVVGPLAHHVSEFLCVASADQNVRLYAITMESVVLVGTFGDSSSPWRLGDPTTYQGTVPISSGVDNYQHSVFELTSATSDVVSSEDAYLAPPVAMREREDSYQNTSRIEGPMLQTINTDGTQLEYLSQAPLTGSDERMGGSEAFLDAILRDAKQKRTLAIATGSLASVATAGLQAQLPLPPQQGDVHGSCGVPQLPMALGNTVRPPPSTPPSSRGQRTRPPVHQLPSTATTASHALVPYQTSPRIEPPFVVSESPAACGGFGTSSRRPPPNPLTPRSGNGDPSTTEWGEGAGSQPTSPRRLTSPRIPTSRPSTRERPIEGTVKTSLDGTLCGIPLPQMSQTPLATALVHASMASLFGSDVHASVGSSAVDGGSSGSGVARHTLSVRRKFIKPPDIDLGNGIKLTDPATERALKQQHQELLLRGPQPSIVNNSIQGGFFLSNTSSALPLPPLRNSNDELDLNTGTLQFQQQRSGIAVGLSSGNSCDTFLTSVQLLLADDETAVDRAGSDPVATADVHGAVVDPPRDVGDFYSADDEVRRGSSDVDLTSTRPLKRDNTDATPSASTKSNQTAEGFAAADAARGRRASRTVLDDMPDSATVAPHAGVKSLTANITQPHSQQPLPLRAAAETEAVARERTKQLLLRMAERLDKIRGAGDPSLAEVPHGSANAGDEPGDNSPSKGDRQQHNLVTSFQRQVERLYEPEERKIARRNRQRIKHEALQRDRAAHGNSNLPSSHQRWLPDELRWWSPNSKKGGKGTGSPTRVTSAPQATPSTTDAPDGDDDDELDDGDALVAIMRSPEAAKNIQDVEEKLRQYKRNRDMGFRSGVGGAVSAAAPGDATSARSGSPSASGSGSGAGTHQGSVGKGSARLVTVNPQWTTRVSSHLAIEEVMLTVPSTVARKGSNAATGGAVSMPLSGVAGNGYAWLSAGWNLNQLASTSMNSGSGLNGHGGGTVSSARLPPPDIMGQKKGVAPFALPTPPSTAPHSSRRAARI